MTTGRAWELWKLVISSNKWFYVELLHGCRWYCRWIAGLRKLQLVHFKVGRKKKKTPNLHSLFAGFLLHFLALVERKRGRSVISGSPRLYGRQDLRFLFRLFLQEGLDAIPQNGQNGPNLTGRLDNNLWTMNTFVTGESNQVQERCCYSLLDIRSSSPGNKKSLQSPCFLDTSLTRRSNTSFLLLWQGRTTGKRSDCWAVQCDTTSKSPTMIPFLAYMGQL